MSSDRGYDYVIDGGRAVILMDGDLVLEDGRSPRGAVRIRYEVSGDNVADAEWLARYDTPSFVRFGSGFTDGEYSIVEDTDLDGAWDSFIKGWREATGETQREGNDQIGYADVPVYGYARAEYDISDLNLAVPEVELLAHHDDYADFLVETLEQVAFEVAPLVWEIDEPAVTIETPGPSRQEITVVQHIDEEDVLWSKEFVLDFSETKSVQDVHSQLDEITSFLADPDVNLIG